MALTSQQLDYLRTADQRFRGHIALFPAWSPTVTAPVIGHTNGTLLAPKPMIQFSPRYATVNNGAGIDIYVGDTYLRGGGAAGTKNWSVDVGSLSAPTGDTVTFTAPANGSGVAIITVTCANAAGTSTSYAYVQYPKTLYDEVVAEIATIQGSLSQHGWKATLRVRGDTADFVIGKRILLHVEDTWDAITNTFGGYKYPEGVVMGYITETEYFEDAVGDAWLGIEVQSPWWMLGRIKVGELWWGTVPEGGKFYIPKFTPVDSIWKFVQDITDWSKQHNTTLFFDTNIIDDFITEESDLATLFADIMARTMCITYCDRYGSLFCVPDPDVRADEYWGTPTSTYTLNSNFVMNYAIKTQAYQVRKLVLAAFDSSKLGIFAGSENPTAQGEVQTIRGLLCDSNLALVDWAVSKRGQMNRAWWIEAQHPLNHVLDLNNFVDAVFTAHSLSGMPTASGQCYADSINYRPDNNGGWQGSIRYLKRTEGDGQAETGAISGGGGTGSNWPGNSGTYTGSAQYGSGYGGWTPPAPVVETWCYTFNFSASGGLWQRNTSNADGDTGGVYVAGIGWEAQLAEGGVRYWGTLLRGFPTRVITGFVAWVSGQTGVAASDNGHHANAILAIPVATVVANAGGLAAGGGSLAWAGTITSNQVAIDYQISTAAGGTPISGYVVSARVAGIGTNPFGGPSSGDC